MEAIATYISFLFTPLVVEEEVEPVLKEVVVVVLVHQMEVVVEVVVQHPINDY